MKLTKQDRQRFRRVLLLYDEPGLSHSIVKFADLLPVVFENFPHAEVLVYNNDNNVATLWRAPAGRVLTVLPSLPHIGPEALTLRFRKSFDPIDIHDQVHGPTIFFHTFGNQLDSGQEAVDVYHLRGKAAVHLRLPVTGQTIRHRQQEILAALGFEGARPGAPGAVLDETHFSPELKKQIKEYQTRYPELRGERPVVLANILKKMDGCWLHDGESPHSIKARWLTALEKIVRHMSITLILNEGPREWQDQTVRRYPATGSVPTVPTVSTWHMRTARQEIVSLYASLRRLPGGKASLLRLREHPINVMRLAALLHVTQKSGGALLDVNTGSSHLAEWMQTPEVLEHSYHLGQKTGSRSNMKRVLPPVFAMSRDEAGQVLEMRGLASAEEQVRFANDVVLALNELIAETQT